MADNEPQKPPRRSFRSFIWDTDTHLKSAEERRLLRKLDWSILTIGGLGFFMKYLDQGNLANAYVSGMQEDLAMYGNEYTYAQTVYTCAYAIMQVPSTLIVQKIRPSVWLVFMEVGWGVWTFAQAGMHNVSELYAFRFLVGLFESSFFPVLLYVLGSWYTKTELAKRVAIFHVTAPLGSAFGGYLQAAVYESLNGRYGLEAVFYTWANEVCAGDNEERALVISSMNGMQYAFDAWIPILIYPQTMAPSFRYGFPATFGFVFAAIIAVIIIRLLVLRESKNRLKSTEDLGEGGVVELVNPDDEKGSMKQAKGDEK
ncbi:hypothetical protein Daus18300_008781 [Diaporthe australafricana]|uniref:Pantothenate transporter liz1 n=1 Tax=Diaporthe australafricana TaxID=127596 RepID=A0ABR3WGM9_9PEZI